MTLPAAEIINETMWVVYYAISKKSSKFIVNGIEVNENFWVDTFSSKDKLSGSLKTLGISSDLVKLSYEVKNIDSKMTEKDATSYFVKNKWHEALKSQVSKFISNPKFSFISGLKIIRQSDFYDESGLSDFLKKVWNIFKFSGTFDRWNPADVWFYNPNSIKDIKDYMKVCSVYKTEIKYSKDISLFFFIINEH